MKEISKGDVFVLPAKNVTQLMINHYADAAEDHNPLHVDLEFAKTTRFGGTIAHGMLSVAFIQELMVRTFGRGWLENGVIEVSFMAPVRPGEVITAEAKVLKVVPAGGPENKLQVRMQVVCLNGKQEKVIRGTTEVIVS
jgi:3-hydroxybutyryl-CoA dehydratase